MVLKDFWSKTGNWLQSHKPSGLKNYHPPLDNEGLINPDDESKEPDAEETAAPGNTVVVKTIQPIDKSQSIEKLQDGFNKLIEQLQGINEHLNRQVTQHEDLMNRIDKMPGLLESFPTVVENQKQSTEQLLEQLKTTATKNQQFIDAIEKIPTETAKQTDALVEIDHQLAAAADTDVQMVESFNNFNQILDKLNQTSTGQTDSIMQMSKTFSTSDRYLKYLMSVQNKRFMWIFMTALSVCLFIILLLTGIIIYIKQ